MSDYYCKHCGTKFSSISILTGNNCSYHPLGSCKGKHELYEGSVKTKYECKFCGNAQISLAHLVINKCSRHPLGSCKGNHEAAL